MKAPPDLTATGRLRRTVGGAILLATLAACGYKGPLYLPPPPPPDAKLAAPPTSQPLPADDATTAPLPQHSTTEPTGAQ